MTLTLEHIITSAREHFERGETKHAEIFYRQALKGTDPPNGAVARLARGEACLFFAREARARGKYGTAADWYYDAIRADPLAVDYRVEMCVFCLIPMGLFKDARMEAERATRIDPTHPRAWKTFGDLLHKLGDVPGSIAAYEKQIELAPDQPGPLLDRATIALDTADYDTVRRLCEAILPTPMGPDARHCLAMVAYREGRHEDAVGLYDEAIAAGCYDPALARWNKSLALHSVGRYREGWAEHEQRGKQKTDGTMSRLMNRFKLPMWNGEPAPARLHVHQEMGHGDVIAMARYLPLLVAHGYDVRFEVVESMVDLMRGSLGGVKVMPRSADYPDALGLPVFDYHVPMLSLPAIFGTDIDTVPWLGPYLKADPALVARYREQVPRGAAGLCWSSGIRQEGVWLKEYGKRKSMQFQQLAPLLKLERSYASLQVGPEREQLSGWGAIGVLDLLPDHPTWADTAALIECLDLVITVDTSVAHLAGAMGKPVWVMMHTEGSWHWMADREGAPWQHASPWYPSAKLYRQKRPHEWAPVVQQIASDLRA